jgi:hypothetical protein
MGEATAKSDCGKDGLIYHPGPIMEAVRGHPICFFVRFDLLIQRGGPDARRTAAIRRLGWRVQGRHRPVPGSASPNFAPPRFTPVQKARRAAVAKPDVNPIAKPDGIAMMG